MDYFKIIVKLISLVFIAIGIIMVYDARKISKKWFKFNDTNTSAKFLKIVGFIIAALASVVIIVNI